VFGATFFKFCGAVARAVRAKEAQIGHLPMRIVI
jgi:hypothetical protein